MPTALVSALGSLLEQERPQLPALAPHHPIARLPVHFAQLDQRSGGRRTGIAAAAERGGQQLAFAADTEGPGGAFQLGLATVADDDTGERVHPSFLGKWKLAFGDDLQFAAGGKLGMG